MIVFLEGTVTGGPTSGPESESGTATVNVQIDVGMIGTEIRAVNDIGVDQKVENVAAVPTENAPGIAIGNDDEKAIGNVSVQETVNGKESDIIKLLSVFPFVIFFRTRKDYFS